MDLTEERIQHPRLEAEATRVQSSCLSEGPLVGLGLFHTAAGDHLLIAIHHLVVDGVSWRILLEDFVNGMLRRSKARRSCCRRSRPRIKRGAQVCSSMRKVRH